MMWKKVQKFNLACHTSYVRQTHFLILKQVNLKRMSSLNISLNKAYPEQLQFNVGKN